MIARVLVALDQTSRASVVFGAAVEIAERFGAKMWLLRVVALPAEFPPGAHVSGSDPLPEHLKTEIVNELAPYTSGEHAGRIEAVIVSYAATPWRRILEEADGIDADLIVMGSHGYRGLDRVLGTTAGNVANRAVRNVLVVHDRASTPPPPDLV